VLFALLAGTAGMAISYGMVRHLTRDLSLTPRIDEAALTRSSTLRNQTNRLVDLSLEYLDHIPLDAQAPKPGAVKWVQSEFRPRLQHLRSEIEERARFDAAVVSAGSAPHRALLAAMDRLATMAAHPVDMQLRAAAIRDVRRAVTNTDEYLNRRHLGRYIGEVSRLPWLPRP
jgi:hypothetical protein